jgi:uncharacterized protein (DUF1330 family)
MPAYVIVESDVTDPEQYKHYMAATPAAVASGGGRFIVRGGETVTLEGDWQPKRIVVVEFDDLEAAQHWYASQEYQAAKAHREGAATLRVIAVAGCD